MKPLNFVREVKRRGKDSIDQNLSAKEVKSFYDNLVGINAAAPETNSLGSEDNKEDEEDVILCSVCKQEYRMVDKDEHFKSLAHMAVRPDQDRPTVYAIPHDNKGFQLLQKSGWSVGRGLGEREQGIKYPLSAKQNLDRRGLGSSSSTSAPDKSASESQATVKRKKVSSNKKDIQAEYEKEKRFRTEMFEYLNRP